MKSGGFSIMNGDMWIVEELKIENWKLKEGDDAGRAYSVQAVGLQVLVAMGPHGQYRTPEVCGEFYITTNRITITPIENKMPTTKHLIRSFISISG